MEHLPDDSNGDAIRLLQAHGVDIGKARVLEFAIEVKDRECGQWAAKILSENGLDSEVVALPDGITFELIVFRRMVPSYADVVEFQWHLASLLKERDLSVAGWGTRLDLDRNQLAV